MTEQSSVPAVKADIERAKAGDAPAAARERTETDPPTTEAAEQEAADGPGERGLSR